jgi:hypothetical protein
MPSDLFSASAIYQPLWILFGFASGFFTRAVSKKWKISGAVAVVVLMLLAWRSGVRQTRAQFQDHEILVAIAKKVGVSPDSPGNAILMAVEDKIAAHDSGSAIVKPPSHEP